MDKLASRIIAEGLSVRSTEEIVAMKIASGEQPKKPKTSKTNPWVGSAIQQSLENHFDTKVSIKGSTKHGRIEIVFSSPEDMDRILQLLVENAQTAKAMPIPNGCNTIRTFVLSPALLLCSALYAQDVIASA